VTPPPRSRTERRRGTSRPTLAGGRRLLSEAEFAHELHLAIAAGAGASATSLVHIGIHETPRLRGLFGADCEAEISRQLGALVLANTRATDAAAYLRRGSRYALLLPEARPRAVNQRLDRLSRQIAGHAFEVGGERLRVTPIVGLAEVPGGITPDEAHRRAETAVRHADTRLDLLVARYASIAAAEQRGPAREDGGRLGSIMAPLAGMLIATLVPFLLPLLFYLSLGAAGFGVTRVVYVAVVLALVSTALAIFAECFHALRRVEPPGEPAEPYPAASAIIVAYLPNEVATVVDTVEAFLRLEYQAPLQVIVAYNTPLDLPIERVLHEIAARDPRLLPLRVEQSTSKAQNVNAALREVTGEFVGVFDADHHPEAGSFARAWRWLSHGCDVVQGHCSIRNGAASWLARVVAVEFETIYAVAHPGRARLHGFGIFGGSNGYWRTDRLHQMRMRMFMLTEDIDSSIRALLAGFRIVSDPGLVSRELSPATLPVLWSQRMRWAQGWFQVALRYLAALLRARSLTVRQKIGVVYLLGWSQVYPWISGQILPILAFWTIKQGWRNIEWLIPLWIATSVLTLSTGPVRACIAYRLAVPELRRRPGWFLFYIVAEPFFFAPLKNLIVRVAQIHELMGERQWKVTTRAVGAESAPGAA
jgi:cellulose synthase/poly-beta-1,6-N-acetylglucosamine synthase-like glycosyltransferase/GGDEF domain-containing protein